MLSVRPVTATRPAPFFQPPSGPKTMMARVTARSSALAMVLKGSPFTYRKGAVVLLSLTENHLALLVSVV